MEAPVVSGRLGAGDPCPLCGGRSGVTPNDDGFSCLTCGGPRVVLDAAVPRSGTEKPSLERARTRARERALWGALAGISGALGGVSLVASGILAAFVHLGGAGGEVLAALSLGPLLFSAFGFTRVRKANAAVREALDAAELAVASDLAAARGAAPDGAELAKTLHVSPSRAEQLAASLQVERFLDEGDGQPGPRVRVADDGEREDAAEAMRRNRTP